MHVWLEGEKMKKRLGIFFGGQSPEHEVSIFSARNILRHADREKYFLIPIGITRSGELFSVELEAFLEEFEKKKLRPFEDFEIKKVPVNISEIKGLIDIAFPVLHGPMGEDGTIQGLFKFLGIPFVGADVLGSAIGMDKDVTKRLLRDGGFDIVDFIARRSRFSYRGATYPLVFVVFEHTTKLGFFHPALFEIGINRRIMIQANQNDLLNLIRHELAHYITWIETGGRGQAHGNEFREICRKYGWGKEVYASMCEIEKAIETPLEEDRLLQKIKKLLALGTSNNVHEA